MFMISFHFAMKRQKQEKKNEKKNSKSMEKRNNNRNEIKISSAFIVAAARRSIVLTCSVVCRRFANNIIIISVTNEILVDSFVFISYKFSSSAPFSLSLF